MPVSVYTCMLGTKYEFVQIIDCDMQTMNPYFVRAIHGLRVHVRLNFFNFLYLCTCMACINQLAS